MMPDFDMKKSLQDGLRFSRVFTDVLIYSISIFIAFYWNSLFNEVVRAFLPDSQGLLQKFIIGVVMTLFMGGGAFLLLKYEIYKDNLRKKQKTGK